jgi:hypothetical protein
LTNAARSTADSRAESGNNLNSGSGSQVGAGGDGVKTAQQAYEQLMKNHKSTILDCSRTTLGIGQEDAQHSTGVLCPVPILCSTTTRYAWVGNFS